LDEVKISYDEQYGWLATAEKVDGLHTLCKGDHAETALLLDEDGAYMISGEGFHQTKGSVNLPKEKSFNCTVIRFVDDFYDSDPRGSTIVGHDTVCFFPTTSP
jgi:hypothetical protein